MANPPERPTPVAAGDGEGRKHWHAGTLTYTKGGLVLLFVWLLWGDLAWSLRERSVFSVVQIMLKRFEASDFLTGLLVGTIPSAWGLILGPIISYRSDRHRGKWGRRIPFLLIPTPVIVLSMVGLGYSPILGRILHEYLGSHSPGLNASTLIFIGTFWMFFEVSINIAGQNIYYGLINDVVPQPLLGRFFGMFRAVALLAAMIFNFFLMGKAETHYLAIFLGFGLLYAVGFSGMCFKVKEGQYPPPPPVEAKPGWHFVSSIRQYAKDCFGQPYYLWVFATISLPMLMVTPVWVFGVFFAQSVKMDMGTYGKYLTVTYMISFALSYPIGSLADRFHPLRVGIVTLILYAIVTFLGGLFAIDARIFGATLIVQSVLAGAWMTGTASLGQRLFPKAKFAQFYTAQAVLYSLGNMVLIPLIGKLLDSTGHTYRYVFLISSGIAVVALFAILKLHRQFMALGGPQHYQAPE